MPSQVTRLRATMIGATAVLMWSTLGLFGAASGGVPPFLLNALCFGIAGLGATAWLALRGRLVLMRQPCRVYGFGILGLFGFHFFYFTAIRNAPPVDANLINYTWPLLIVVFSAFLPGERLKIQHVAGTLLGLGGAALLILRGDGLALDGDAAPGYFAAVASALFWSGYSVLSRRLGSVPTEAVAGFCLGTSLLSVAAHLVFETTVWPQGTGEWSAVLGLAAFPVGLAFFVWDIGVKRGDIQVLGAFAYTAPVSSTLLLIVFGFGDFTLVVMAACALVTLGALVAAKDMLFGRFTKKTGGVAAGERVEE
ncbi:DMT family transporter [Stappia sp. ES.058]|uniref:aromatic amino acid exporter YddG n=1 Tax=Stappia sp. ES.058 TaxID=1881061 RepID=UPI000879B0E4|nr:DMT family transporter [Stappia sp. ES.058]SDU39701.1 Permease of the drug/metabolite transporter (DMT) superfamily [Stappia sp. ES.058]